MLENDFGAGEVASFAAELAFMKQQLRVIRKMPAAHAANIESVLLSPQLASAADQQGIRLANDGFARLRQAKAGFQRLPSFLWPAK